MKRLWALLPLLIVPVAWWLLGSDIGFFLLWWLAFALIGWLVWPLAARLFPGGDNGYLLAKPLGLALTSLLLWTLSYLQILPFSRWAIVLVLCAVGLLCWLVKGNWRQLDSLVQEPVNIRRAAAGELLFGAALLFWAFARGLKPEIDGLEKFMDFGFMNSLWRTDFLPAVDMWYAGGQINYYYFGQYLYTFLAKLTGIAPAVAYNLSMASTFALTFSMAYAVVSRLLALLRRKTPKLPRAANAIGGLLAAWLVALGGNSHAFFYDTNSPGNAWLSLMHSLGLVGGSVDKPFYFPDSTRFIGFNPDIADKTIHEFPLYSFLVADLHAHVINMAFVLLLVALLIGLFQNHHLRQSAVDCHASQQANLTANDRDWHRAELKQVFRRLRVTTTNLPLLVIIVLLAIAMMGNFWDFAIYFAMTALVLFWINLRGYGRVRLPGVAVFVVQCVLILIPFLAVSLPWLAVVMFLVVLAVNHYLTLVFGDALTLTGAQMSWIFFLTHLLSLPFNSSFSPMSKSIALAETHTPLWQLLVLWGPHLMAGLLLVVFLLIFARQRRTALRPGAFSPADLMACIVLACAAGLILLPELVYVVDIYTGAKRANTMFKFTYQAFILLSMVWAYAVVRVTTFFAASCRRSKDFTAKPAWGAGVISVILIVTLIMPSWYTLPAIHQWLDNFSTERYQGLEGTHQLAVKGDGILAADYAAIQWFNQNVTGQPVILEASGDSWTDYCRISAYTGLPTVIGWTSHEWLWRTIKTTSDGMDRFVAPRQEDVRLMYTTTDPLLRTELLKKYQVAYIIVGDLERDKYSGLQEEALIGLGTVVFHNESLVIIELAS